MISHNHPGLRLIEESINQQLRQLLAFDNIVKDSTGQIIHGHAIRIARTFSYDILSKATENDNDKSFVHFDFSCLKNFIRLFEVQDQVVSLPTFFLLPILRQGQASYICSLILIEVTTVQNHCIGYAQCLDNGYSSPKEIKLFFNQHNIELLDNLIKPMDLEQSLAYVKDLALLRINIFTTITQRELIFISNNFGDTINLKQINLSIEQSSEKQPQSIAQINHNRFKLIHALENKLQTLEWFDVNRIIYCYLLRKLHTGIPRYLNENNQLIFNISYFKKYEKLGVEIERTMGYFSEFTCLEYQILWGLNEYIVTNEDNINDTRRVNIDFHYSASTHQDYIKAFIGESTRKNMSIGDIYTRIKSYIDNNHPPEKAINLGFTEIKFEQSLLGRILYQCLDKIENMIKENWGRFTLKKSANPDAAIKEWGTLSGEADVLFLADSSNSWTCYKKTAIKVQKLIMATDNSLSDFLNGLPTLELSMGDSYKLGNLLYHALYPQPFFKSSSKYSNSNHVPSLFWETRDNTNQTSILIKTNENEVGAQSEFPNIPDKLKKLQETVIELENKIKQMDTNINLLTDNNKTLSGSNAELYNKLQTVRHQCNEVIANLYISFEKLVTELEKQLNLIKSGKMNPDCAASMVSQVEIISNFSELKRTKSQIKQMFGHKEIYLCRYKENISFPEIKAPIIVFGQNGDTLKLYGNMQGAYQLASVPQKVTDKIYELLDETNFKSALASSSKDVIEIRTDPIKIYKLLKLFKDNKLHHYQVDSKKILTAQKNILERCELIKKEASELQLTNASSSNYTSTTPGFN